MTQPTNKQFPTLPVSFTSVVPSTGIFVPSGGKEGRLSEKQVNKLVDP